MRRAFQRRAQQQLVPVSEAQGSETQKQLLRSSKEEGNELPLQHKILTSEIRERAGTYRIRCKTLRWISTVHSREVNSTD